MSECLLTGRETIVHDSQSREAAVPVQVGMKVPLVVRLEGTNVEKGKEILKNSDVSIITADDLDDAATKAVKSISQ